MKARPLLGGNGPTWPVRPPEGAEDPVDDGRSLLEAFDPGRVADDFPAGVTAAERGDARLGRGDG